MSILMGQYKYQPIDLVIPKTSVMGPANLAAELPVIAKTTNTTANLQLESIFQRSLSFFK
jgi:hypothetical protein